MFFVFFFGSLIEAIRRQDFTFSLLFYVSFGIAQNSSENIAQGGKFNSEREQQKL